MDGKGSVKPGGAGRPGSSVGGPAGRERSESQAHLGNERPR